MPKIGRVFKRGVNVMKCITYIDISNNNNNNNNRITWCKASENGPLAPDAQNAFEIPLTIDARTPVHLALPIYTTDALICNGSQRGFDCSKAALPAFTTQTSNDHAIYYYYGYKYYYYLKQGRFPRKTFTLLLVVVHGIQKRRDTSILPFPHRYI